MLIAALTAGIALIPLVLAASEPGNEILYPAATVILGGLISSTLLDFFVHPALFWCFGRRQAERHLQEGNAEDELLVDYLHRPVLRVSPSLGNSSVHAASRLASNHYGE